MTDTVLTCAECGVRFVWNGADRPEHCPMCQLLAPAPGRERGIVKWFSRARGYGFVTPIVGSELFLHQSGMADGQPLPRAGQLVEYTRTQGARGAQAGDAEVLEREIEAP